MSYTLQIATTEARDLVVASLRASADQRTRVARRASAEVMADKGSGKDPRSGAVKVTALLNEANTLTDLADELAAATDLVLLTTGTGLPFVPPGTEANLVGLTGDDGTSPAAQALAELAGLTTPLDPAAVEDPETHELPEDRAATPVDVATTALGTTP